MKIFNCPICNSSTLLDFFTIEEMPVHIGILWPSKDSAKAAPKGDIKLVFCKNCGHIFNASFDELLMTYDLPYDNSLFFSDVFQNYAKQLSENLIKKYSLWHKNILEIGSGRGDFLKLICDLGENNGWGFDPSYQPDFNLDTNKDKLTFFKGYYNKNLITENVDFIYARHVLEHLTDPKSLIQQLRSDFIDHKDTIFYFEVPNADYMLRKANLWDLIYEHCQYFTSSSLSYLFEHNGFKILDLYEMFNNQYLCIECKIQVEEKKEAKKITIDETLVTQFSIKSKQIISWWKEYLQKSYVQGTKCVVWGAGAKGVSFLNILHNEDTLIGVVDINPNKQGKYIPLTGQRISLPGELKIINPEKVIIMNSIYLPEIKKLVEANGFQQDICITV